LKWFTTPVEPLNPANREGDLVFFQSLVVRLTYCPEFSQDRYLVIGQTSQASAITVDGFKVQLVDRGFEICN
jgi:hypothetical protein